MSDCELVAPSSLRIFLFVKLYKTLRWNIMVTFIYIRLTIHPLSNQDNVIPVIIIITETSAPAVPAV